jgi:hypothetical protein
LARRTPEIEQAILTRVYSVGDPASVADPSYAAGLRAAVAAAVRYGLGGLEAPRPASLSVPVELLAQVRSAACNRVPLETVLRRYVAGHALLSDFVIEEAKAHKSADPGELQRLVRLQAEIFDRLLEAVAAEYRVGLRSSACSPQRSRAECAEKLLAGQPIDTAELGYPLGGWHLAIACIGAGVEAPLREFATRHDRRLLLLPRAEGVTWAWLGGARHPCAEEVEGLLGRPLPPRARLAIGEPGKGLAGWRFSHRQALAALPVAMRGERPALRYAGVALLAAALGDELLAVSLRRLYLDPLSGEGHSGEVLFETLDAYFAAQGNSSSAAATLGVTRQTVANRLRVVEERLGRPLNTCGTELEVGLGLQALAS